ncbi:hypothetical protein JHD48_01855 [Sulfurimonas sp. SAG-AH-194-I05]|nr:putative metalloprotease CJM1_0395 family protein [Sulfurimonas sp. SAG-AH-194-I05]MDF1874473.1 hypothetical protein [Sulfurimonas sp. SAG-AH-194-I05]
MITGTSSFGNISTSYTIKLNEEESLVFRKEKKEQSPDAQRIEEETKRDSKNAIKSSASKELSQGEEKLLVDLEARDAEVRAHESAHQSVGGGMTGAATFTYQQGPDGKMYAIGGEVSISTSGGSTPQESIANARQVAAAAMAAGDPSSQDFAVASSARVIEMKAQQQLTKERQNEALGKEAYQNAQNSNTIKQDTSKTKEPFDISA